VRPLRLEIEGFTAFREHQAVDFESLDLFVITGPTGAGKTSILDAMIFALYGRVPRMGAHGLADLVSHGRVDARVMLEFAIDGERYRVARRLSRRVAQQAHLERLEGEAWVPEVDAGGVRACNERLDELLRLGFDSFCKAVVLPQGEFHRFLKGDPPERRQVLIALLGVGYFQRMAEIARSRAAGLRAGVERTEEILADQYAAATAERVAELQNVSAEAADRAARLVQALADAEGHLARAAAEHAQREAIESLQDAASALAEELEAEVSACETATQAAARAEERLRTTTSEVEARRLALSELEDRSAQTEASHGSPEELALVSAALATLTTVEKERERAADKVEEAEASERHAASELERARTALADALRARDETEQVASRAADEATELRRQARDLDSIVRAARDRHGEREVARKRAISAAERAEATRAAAESAREALTAAEAELENQQREHAAARLRLGLVPGDPCPVCERPIEEHVATETGEGAILESAVAAARDARATAQALDRDAASALAELAAAERALAECEQRLLASLSEHAELSTLEGEAIATAERATDAERAQGEAREAAQRAREAADDAREEFTRWQAALERCSATREAAQRTIGEVSDRREQALATIQEHFGGEVPEDAADRVERARNEVNGARDAVAAARASVDEAVAEQADAREGVDAARRALADVDVRLAELGARASATAGQANLALAAVDPSPISDMPEPAEERGATARELASWCSRTADALGRAAASATAAAERAEAELLAVAREYGVDEASAEQSLSELRRSEREAAAGAVKAEAEAEQAARRLKEREDLEERIRDDREHIAVLETLGRDLRANHFGEFLVQETLEILALRASDELRRISDGRYSLVPHEGDFSVVDHANADEERSVKTLSGGETFMASLSLALALSRHVGELAGEGLGAKLEAVFIDEGFGTLDPETLEEVIDALERLREDELLVGVISHVPSLAERVRSGLEVQKNGGRSTIVPR
jgi:exonuclease SbcC